eukprot:GFKZ01000581.1.p1 GENE.GFKZ01000581.1~~GFKZ01000581.1.p1  ORF type:complete len:683 (+),score=51.42 GFKZ01000581.1:155-2050(+)
MTAPSILAYSLLLFFPVLTSAQQDPSDNQTITIPVNQTHTAAVNLTLSQNTTLPIRLSGDGFLLIEYIPNEEALRVSRFDEGLPNLLLSLSNTPNDIPYITTGKATDANDQKEFDYDCNATFPCFKNFSLVDAESFYTRSTRASLVHRLPPASTSPTYYATLLNYDRTPPDATPSASPTINGELRMTFSVNRTCPGYIGETKDQCFGSGECVPDGCDCDPKVGGRVCEADVFTEKNDIPTVPQPADGWTVPPYGNGTVIEVQGFQTKYFVWNNSQMGHVGVRFFFRVIEGDRLNVRVMARRMTSKPRNQILDEPPLLPTEFDSKDSCKPFPGGRDLAFVCLVELSKESENQVTLAIVSDSAKAQRSTRSVVSFRSETCGGALSGRRSCTIGVFPWLVVPLSVVIISITGLATLIMLWLDRRHGFTDPVDRLSEKELDRMYPKRKFGDRDSDLQSEEEECLICLSPFERGEFVRQLQCKHMYHSDCLDPWLIQNNASCPTCRADVRLDHLSDKRYLRKIVTVFLWPIVLVRRVRERRTERRSNETGPVGRDVSGDIETGQRSLTVDNVRDSESGSGQTVEVENSNYRVVPGIQDSATAVEIANQEVDNSAAGPRNEGHSVDAKSTPGLGSEG